MKVNGRLPSRYCGSVFRIEKFGDSGLEPWKDSHDDAGCHTASACHRKGSVKKTRSWGQWEPLWSALWSAVV